MQFIEDAKKIQFDEAKHIYTYEGKELISVTSLIDLYKAPFDPTGEILISCAKKAGIPKSELKKQWEEKGDKAGKIGSLIHENVEHYIKTGKIKKNKYTKIIEQFAALKFRGKLYPESIIFDSDIGVAGTSDIIQIIDNKILQIHDIKTNEKKPTDYSFGKYMKPPLDHLPSGKLILYELQISLYLYLLSSKYGFQIGENHFIFWINRNKEEIVKIPIRLRIQEVIDLIADYVYTKNLNVK